LKNMIAGHVREDNAKKSLLSDGPRELALLEWSSNLLDLVGC
jgi:hypothetical protein